MIGIKQIPYVLGLISALMLCSCHPAHTNNGKVLPVNGETWISLFNGKDLTGWTPKFAGHDLGVNYKNTFRAEDGVLKVAYDQYEQFDGKFGHLFYEHEYSHYRLRLEYRFLGEQMPGAPGWAFRNSGVMIHGQPAASMKKDQNFPVSIEVQMLGGDGENDRPTGNLCTPGTHVVMQNALVKNHCINSRSATFHEDDWITLEVEVRGNDIIRHFINGELVIEYTKPQYDPNDKDAQPLIEKQNGSLVLDHGTISLQAESHPCEFRNIQLLLLDHRE